MKFYIVVESLSLVTKFYLTLGFLERRWTTSFPEAESFLSKNHALNYLKAIGHSGVGVKIIRE